MSLSERNPPRTRSTDSRETTTTIGRWGNGVGGSGEWSAISATEGMLKSIQDYEHPDFRAALARGRIIMGDLILDRWERSYTSGLHNTGIIPHTGGYWSEVTGDLAALVEESTADDGFEPANVGDLPRMSELVLVKVYSKMNSAPIMFGEILGDLDQTVGMLKRPFGSARDVAKRMLKYRNKRIGKTAASVAKANASAWLEYRYGWRPIVLDSLQIVEEAQKLRRKTDRLRQPVARSEVRSDFDKSKTFALVPMPDNPAWEASGTVTKNLKLRACGGLIYDSVSQTTTEQLQKSLGLRSNDLLTTAWELVPYSFVVDWFVNVGTWLEAVTPNPYVEVRASWVTTISDYTETWVSSGMRETHRISNWPVYYSYGSWGGSVIKRNIVRRDCNPALPFTPTLTKRSLSKLQQADAMSLSLKPILATMKRMR